MRQQPVDPSHADIIQPQHAAAQDLSSQRRLLGDRDITGAAGGDDDRPQPVRRRHRANHTDPARGMVGKRQLRRHVSRRLLAHPRDEHCLLPPVPEGGGDARNLLRRLSRAVDDLRRALAQPPVAVDLRKAQILKRGHFQLQRRVLR